MAGKFAPVARLSRESRSHSRAMITRTFLVGNDMIAGAMSNATVPSTSYVMSYLDIFRRGSTRKSRPTVVVFAGGMGTQIISAAVYFSIKHAGRPVFADVSYFDVPERLAVAGNAGQLTHWGWQLDPFGLPREAFDTKDGLTERNAEMLFDGPRKLELSLKALAEPEIQSLFKIPAGVKDILPAGFPNNVLCMHVRRGDYVNVASHLIADGEFVRLARRFAGLADHVVVLSDSPIGSDFRGAVSPLFKEVLFLDDIDAFAAHRIMRSASILICSNSTFSLTAAVLNSSGLAIVPKQWYEGGDRHLEAAIHARCPFQIMETGSSVAVSAGEP